MPGIPNFWTRPDVTPILAVLLKYGDYRDYKHFIILENDIRRFIRTLNFEIVCYMQEYWSNDLPNDLLLKERLWGLKYFKDDEHFIPQEEYIEKVIEQFFGGSVEDFEKTVEIVSLKEFPDWFKKTFGVERILKNVNPDDKKRFFWDKMPEDQKKAVTDYVNQKPCRYPIK